MRMLANGERIRATKKGGSWITIIGADRLAWRAVVRTETGIEFVNIDDIVFWRITEDRRESYPENLRDYDASVATYKFADLINCDYIEAKEW